MSEVTVFAETLIATVARAFYTDDAVCLIDVLIRDKFLRDDDMGPRLQLSAKGLRKTLQFLQDEHLVRVENVDDLREGGSQTTKYYYLDYNRAVHSIRLRLHLLRKKLEQAELRARSSSFYLCPGYQTKRCNGQYTEEEAQHVLEPTSGRFLCQECSKLYQNDPSAPSIDTYTLELVDNTKELRQAMDNLRRVTVQLSAKSIGNFQLRAGIYDLLQKVRGKGKGPITSNLPSENIAIGAGSKRVEGTGRTASIRAKQREQQGVAVTAKETKEEDLMFLKNAMGNEIRFMVEKGGGARAQLLATKGQRRRKLLDAAASRVGATLPLYIRIEEEANRKRKQEDEERKEQKRKKQKSAKKSKAHMETLEFLYDNIGRLGMEEDKETEQDDDSVQESVEDSSDQGISEMVLCDELAELRKLDDKRRLEMFQKLYAQEVDRQEKLMEMLDDDDKSVTWEEGEAQ